MRGVFGSLTTRGRSFVAAGGAAMVCGLAIPEPDLVRVPVPDHVASLAPLTI